ncbi:BadF/BadG/BcrA/BcrD ATPase family protein [Elstera sp.]|jgi:glucosamine kinase|uniref:BadF/BadG/BcrA/BcrD ATPase family protein n=1 Tax=Elstera sp. TaxID=1916664 RepID=UPI0037BE48FE
MAERLFLGVDGGGTTSRARLTDANGNRLGEGRSGSSNLNMGIALAADSILAATREALAAAGLPESRLGDIVGGFGLAGGNVTALADALRRQPFPFANIDVTSDAVVACLGAHGGNDGGILIVGTGSQGLALVNGTMKTVGGWGFELSDGGSGAQLGLAALRAALLAFDDLGPASGLTDAILARFAGGPPDAAVWGKTATPSDYGSFAPLVIEHFGKGDPVAQTLLAQSINAISAMMRRLIQFGADRIALMGGLAPIFQPLLPPEIQAILVEARGDAMDGALAFARRKGTA